MKNAMNKERRALVVLIGVAAIAVGGSAAGQPPCPGCGFERIIERLDLDGETEAAVEAVIAESRQEGHALRDEVRQAKDTLHELLSQETPDEAAVMAQAETLGDLETKVTKHRLATLLRIRSLLTPEQRAELKEIQREHRASIMEACAAEVEVFCSDAKDPRQTVRCLRRRAEELTDDCREALPRRGRGRGFRPGPRLGSGLGPGPGPF